MGVQRYTGGGDPRLLLREIAKTRQLRLNAVVRLVSLTEVVRSRDGRLLLTRPTREHPDFMRLLCTWIRSTRPFPDAFPFTSISLNSQYGAKAHRDGNNAGPSLTRSLGNFVGGALKYWDNDDGLQAIAALPAQAAQILDTRSGFCLFDGKRCHAVSDFVGERFSLVFFSISQYAKVPQEQRALLPDYTQEAALQTFHRMLGPPRGYSVGRLQQSIWGAFGYRERDQALRWPAQALHALPKDALLLISRFSGKSLKGLSRRFAVAPREG